MTGTQVASLVFNRDLAGLAQLSQRDIDDYLVQLIQGLDNDPYDLDADRLVSLGNTLHLAGWPRADQALESVLAAQPTERRLDAICLILAGLWKTGRTNHPVNADTLDTLIRVHDTLIRQGISADTTRSYHMALKAAQSAGGPPRSSG